MNLIVRHHSADGRESEAVYSACETYRYSLTRVWEPEGKRLLYIMLNPSKATELANDPTIERCERRARALGYGAFRACNLFALRETDPAKLRRHEAPEGPQNVDQIREALDWTDDVLCSWGVHGVHRDQNEVIKTVLRDSKTPVLALGITKEGHPRHPLYMPYSAKPFPWAEV